MPRSSFSRKSTAHSGFTLTELLLAMLVFAIAITTILALLARSIETVDEILLKDESMGLSGAVEDFFENQSFNDSYAIFLAASSNTDDSLLAFNYRAVPGTLAPYQDLGGTLNTDYIITPFVGTVSQITKELLDSVDGRIFLIKMEVSGNNPIPEADILPASDPDEYASAVLVLFAEYYPVSSLENLDVDALGISPAYSYTFAIRR